jgi:hypothetical protein
MSHLSRLLRTSAALISVLASCALVACAETSDETAPVNAASTPAAGEATDDTATAEEDLSSSSRSYVAIRHDNRKCKSPQCGGYFVRDLNRKTTTETYVSGLDFTGSDLDEAAQATVNEAPEGSLVLRARLGKIDKASGTRALVVSEAFRGLPGQASLADKAAGQVYSVQSLNIQCITAPCPAFAIKRLNYKPTSNVTGLDLELGKLVDQSWLADQVAQEGALVLGSVRAGAKLPGGVESILDAAQVFLKVPQTKSCPQFKMAPCKDGLVRTYHRDENRCILPGECVKSMMCALYLPHCDEGFSLVSWTNGNGCSAYACDPTWILPAEQ